MYMQENGTDGRQFVISTDRAQGGASLHNGELMLMVCLLNFLFCCYFYTRHVRLSWLRSWLRSCIFDYIF